MKAGIPESEFTAAIQVRPSLILTALVVKCYRIIIRVVQSRDEIEPVFFFVDDIIDIEYLARPASIIEQNTWKRVAIGSQCNSVMEIAFIDKAGNFIIQQHHLLTLVILHPPRCTQHT